MNARVPKHANRDDMKKIRNLSQALIACVVLAPTFAQALILRADFSGTSLVSQTVQFPPMPVSWYDAQPVTGWFEVEIADATPAVPDRPDGPYWNNGGSQRASFTLRGERFDFFGDASDPGVIEFYNYDVFGHQQLNFRSNPSAMGTSYFFGITDPTRSLYDTYDPASINILPGAPYSFITSFSDREAGILVHMVLDQMNFRVLSPVPEPSTALLLLGGGVALLGWQRRRKAAIDPTN